jgi:hypothetical protein
MAHQIPKAKEVEVEVYAPEDSKVDELLGDLNPRYFEETYTLEYSKRDVYRKHYNAFFGGY